MPLPAQSAATQAQLLGQQIASQQEQIRQAEQQRQEQIQQLQKPLQFSQAQLRSGIQGYQQRQAVEGQRVSAVGQAQEEFGQFQKAAGTARQELATAQGQLDAYNQNVADWKSAELWADKIMNNSTGVPFGISNLPANIQDKVRQIMQGQYAENRAESLNLQLEATGKTIDMSRWTPQQVRDYSTSIAYTMNNTDLKGTGLKAIVVNGQITGFEDSVLQQSYRLQDIPKARADVLISRGVLQAPTMNVPGVPNINLPVGEVSLQIPNASRNMPTGSYSYTSTGERFIPQEKIYIEPGSIPGFNQRVEGAIETKLSPFFKDLRETVGTVEYSTPKPKIIMQRIISPFDFNLLSITPKAMTPKGNIVLASQPTENFLAKGTVLGAETAATIVAWPYAVSALGTSLAEVPVIGARLVPMANEILIGGLGISQTGSGVKQGFDTYKFTTQFSKDNPPLKYSDPHDGIADDVWKSQVDDYNKKLDSAINQAKLTGYGGAALNTLLGLAFIGAGVKGIAFDKAVGMKSFFVEDFKVGQGTKYEVDYFASKGFTDAEARALSNKLKGVEDKTAIDKIIIQDAKLAKVDFSPGYETFITTKVRNLFNMQPIYAARNYAELAKQSSSLVFENKLAQLEKALSKAGYSEKAIGQILSPEAYQQSWFGKTRVDAATPIEYSAYQAKIPSEQEAGNALWNVISTPKGRVESNLFVQRYPEIFKLKTPEVSETSYMLGEKSPWGLRGLKPLSTKPISISESYFGTSLGMSAKFKKGITTDTFTEMFNQALGKGAKSKLLDLRFYEARTGEGKLIRGGSGFAALTEEKIVIKPGEFSSLQKEEMSLIQKEIAAGRLPEGTVPAGMPAKGGKKQVITFFNLPGRITSTPSLGVTRVEADILSAKKTPFYGAKFGFNKAGGLEIYGGKLSPSPFLDTTVRKVSAEYSTTVKLPVSREDLFNLVPGVRGSKVKLGVSTEADMKVFTKLFKAAQDVSVRGVPSYKKETIEIISPRTAKVNIIGTPGKEPTTILETTGSRGMFEIPKKPYIPPTREMKGFMGNAADLEAAASKSEPMTRTIGGKEIKVSDYSKYQKSPFYKGYLKRTNAGPQVSEEVFPTMVGGKGGVASKKFLSMVGEESIPISIAPPAVGARNVKLPTILSSKAISLAPIIGLSIGGKVSGQIMGISQSQPQVSMLSQPQIQIIAQPQMQILTQPQIQIQPMPQIQIMPQPQMQIITQPQVQIMPQPMIQTQMQTQTQVRPQVLLMPPTRPTLEILRPPQVPPPIIPGTKKKSLTLSYKRKPIVKAPTGFTVQVKSKRKFGTPFNISVPKEEAFAFGAAAVIKSASATFKIVPSKLPYRPTGIRPTLLQRAVIRPGKQSNTFVQKERLRIISRGEVKEISNVGAAARRSGSRSKSKSPWGF